MGTRGLYGFYRDGETKATYNHYDSYPTGLGADIARFIETTSIKEMNEIFDKIILVNERVKPTAEQINKCLQFYNDSVSTGQIDEWYALLRGTQGNLHVYKTDMPFMIDSQDFILDSLFCEWAYIINLDTNQLEIYKGFQEEAEHNRYYHPSVENEKYKNCKLIDEIDLNDYNKMLFDDEYEKELCAKERMMEKVILTDDSTCCSECFEMLERGDRVFVEINGNVVCGDCV